MNFFQPPNSAPLSFIASTTCCALHLHKRVFQTRRSPRLYLVTRFIICSLDTMSLALPTGGDILFIYYYGVLIPLFKRARRTRTGSNPRGFQVENLRPSEDFRCANRGAEKLAHWLFFTDPFRTGGRPLNGADTFQGDYIGRSVNGRSRSFHAASARPRQCRTDRGEIAHWNAFHWVIRSVDAYQLRASGIKKSAPS